MKFNKITIALSQLLLISSLSHADTSCKQENFWQNWFPKGEFVGFGKAPSVDKVAKAQYEFAQNYHRGNILTKDYSQDIPQQTSTNVLTIIEDIKVLLRETTEENKEKSLKYVQNLCKICKLYYDTK